MTDRERFEAALAVDRCDVVTRLIFADWLEENGHDDEAVEQRRCAAPDWVEAAKWMAEFAESNGETCDNYALGEEDVFRPITFDEVVNAGRAFAESDGDDYFTQSGEEGLRNAMSRQATREAYWKHWQTLTGKTVSDEVQEGTVFSCSC